MLSSAETASREPAATVFSGGGVMGERMRSLAWSETALGPVDQWPQSLKTSVSTCLNSRFAILVWWGKELVKLYNDAYVPILGNKHPQALGAPGRTVWPEIWHIIGPMLSGVMEQGQATWSDNLLLELERNGYPEECYFTFSYSPIRDESGGVGGVFTPVQETTAQVIGERRLRSLRDLAEAASSASAQSTEHVCRAASESLSNNPYDIPFAAIYLLSQNNRVARLCVASGVASETTFLPDCVALDENAWLFAQAARSGKSEIVPIPAEIDDVPRGAWPVPPREALLIPISPAGQRIGFMILAVSPRKHIDEDYQSFLSLAAGHINTAVADARALEEERKRAEALAELDRAKTQFFSNVSHEFRTPLTLLLGPLDDALSRPNALSPETGEALRVAQRNGTRLLRLVNSLLDFSRMEAGRSNALYELTDVCTLTSELAASFRSAADRAGLTLSVHCPEPIQPVYVDREMWEKIILNLLSNAFKFTFEGTISILLKEENGLLQVQVRDTGIGIPESELPHLFERFHRVEGAQGRTNEGTGIGLALVLELVRLHGGSIRVESTLGEGSTFYLSIPVGKDHLPPERLGSATGTPPVSARSKAYAEEAFRWLPRSSDAVNTSSPTPSTLEAEFQTAGPKTRKTVLLADDNADMRDYIRRLLSPQYDVITASNGTQALELALLKKPDLVLSDIMMPGLDGFALLRTLRANTGTRILPVILLSARAGEEARSDGMNAGADDYMVKPFSARELLARVGAHLKLAEARRQADEQATRSLTAEGRKWRGLFAQVPAAVAVLRGPQHRFEWVNDHYVRLVNRSGAAELLGNTLRDAVPEIVAQGYHEMFDRVFQTGEPHAEREAFVALGSPTSANFYVSFVVLPTRAVDGEIDGTFVHATDVTDLVLARKHVEASEQQFRTLAESIPNLAWMADETGYIFWYNRRWYDFTGTTLDDVKGFDWTKVHDPAVLPAVVSQWTNSLTSGDPFEMVFPLKGANGEFRQFLTRVEPVKDQAGRVVRWFGTNTDISDQRKTEEELRRINRELEEFAYVASHDLREPLRMVNVYTQLLLKRLGPQPGSITQYAEFVRQGVSRMETLIDDLLVFSRTVRSEEFPAEAADLSASFQEAITVLRSTIAETDAVITSAPLPTVRGDASQFTHVFQNLLSNALKYRNRTKTPNVHVSAVREGNEWVISVSDNGIGFEQQYAQRIFGLFKRLHKEEYPGTGLGLAICQRVVERYGGRIWAEGQPGNGAVFHFALLSVVEETAAATGDLPSA